MGWNGGHTVELQIGNQTFRLQEVFKDEHWTSKEHAKWYERMLNIALDNLAKNNDND